MQPISTQLTEREPITFLTYDGLKLFGVVHRPTQRGQYPGVVIYHGFLGSKDQPHRMFVECAEALAQHGIVILRVDLRGRGDSEGDSIDMTWQNDRSDAQAALLKLAALPDVDPQRLATLGLSWGGLLAPIVAAEDERVKAAVIWSAVPTQTLDWQPTYRMFDGREAAENWGLLVGKPFYEGLADFHPLEHALKARCPILLIHGTADESVIAADVQAYQAAVHANRQTCEVIAIEGADHIFFTVQWKRQVIAQTVAWLKARLA